MTPPFKGPHTFNFNSPCLLASWPVDFELLFRSKAQCRSYFRELYQYTQRLYFQTLLVVLYFSKEKEFILVYIESLI